MSLTMKMELLNPYGSTCLLPLSSSSSAKLALSLRACRAHSSCFTRKSWSESILTLTWKKQGRRDAFCLAFATAAVTAVKDDEGKSETGVQITEIKEPNSRVRLNVKVPPRICKESYEQVLEELRKQTQIPGFRRGEKIPDKILVNFVGKEKIKTAAIESVLNKTLPEAMSLVKDRALKDSEHIETKYNALQAAFSTSSFLSYDVAVDLAPEVKWTTPEAYKNLKVVVEVESDAAIERAAEAELKARHKNLGSLKIVQDRGVKMGDVVVLDVSAAQINEDGTDGDKIPFTEQKGFHLDTEESTHLVPGFVNAILGLERGQTQSFQLAFPDTWKQKELQGVLARFTVECKELFYRDLPVLDDTLADKLVNGCTSLSQVQESFLQEHKKIAEAKKETTNPTSTSARTFQGSRNGCSSFLTRRARSATVWSKADTAADNYEIDRGADSYPLKSKGSQQLPLITKGDDQGNGQANTCCRRNIQD